MQPTDIAYTAGLIDGEGSISLILNYGAAHRSQAYWYPAIAVPSTTREIVDYLKDTWEGTISTKKTYADHHKRSWTWAVKYHRALDVLELVRPYLLVPEKCRRADLLLGHYLALTKRNGKYTESELQERINFRSEFLVEVGGIEAPVQQTDNSS